MVKAALIFPGQGAQVIGMGKDLYDNFPQAKEVFDRANEILQLDLKKLCFEGPQEELSTTDNSQPAIFTMSVAALKAFESSGMFQQFDPLFSLGLSLGEYTALVAAGSISFEETLLLVRRRGEFMEAASSKNPSKMACIIGMSLTQVEELCKGIGCEIANLNCPGQIVVSGRINNIGLLAHLAKARGAKRVVMLEVSGAFHSSLMSSARDKLKDYLDKIQIHTPKMSFVSNVDATVQTDPAKIRENLIAQITSRTLWEASIRLVLNNDITTFIEIGPGQILKGILKKIDNKAEVRNIRTAKDIV